MFFTSTFLVSLSLSLVSLTSLKLDSGCNRIAHNVTLLVAELFKVQKWREPFRFLAVFIHPPGPTPPLPVWQLGTHFLILIRIVKNMQLFHRLHSCKALSKKI